MRGPSLRPICRCREHRDLLVVGSSRQGPEGHVRIGKRTRQLLCHFECPLAVAPRGIHARAPLTIDSVGVGFDGGPESEAALALADSIATAAGATLRLRAVADDRVPLLLRSALQGLASVVWTDLVAEREQQLDEGCAVAVQASAASASFDVRRGRPADELLALSREVDLMVVGSRRWGPTARVLLGSTGEALLHDAACAVVAVPRPADDRSA
jgi:nucleotide-binding universal stress UspA family protein